MKTFASALLLAAASAVPTAIFHGLGDACIYPGMKNFTNQISTETNDYAHCIEVGNGSLTSFFMNFEHQAELACENLIANGNFDGEFNVVGLSQGGLLARYIVESCPMKGYVRNFLSIGGPQMGVSDLPGCFSGELCRLINLTVRNMAYYKTFQDHIGPAGYFRDPHHMKEYLADSVFLPYLNNEDGTVDQAASNKARFTALNGAMLVMFTEDSVVYPKESEWFQELNELMNVEPLEKSAFYQSDLIGLKQLNEAGKVQFVSIVGDHLEFTDSDITNTFVPFLLS